VQHYWSVLKKTKLIILIFIIGAAGLAAQHNVSHPEDYDLQVVKFYFQKGEYVTVVNYITELQEESYISDSLNYYNALAYRGLGEDQEALNILSDLIIHSINHDLTDKIVNELKPVLNFQTPSDKIDTISNLISELQHDHNLSDLLFIMADIYEEVHLFEEANDVYRTILTETNVKAQLQIDLLIATNHINLKEYEEALMILEPISSLQDSLLNKDALYYSYNAYLGLGENGSALEDLVELYDNYPNHPRRFEIIQALADIHFQEGNYIVSWYLLEQLKEISDPTQEFNLEREIKQLRDKLSNEEDLEDQFRLFKLDLKQN